MTVLNCMLYVMYKDRHQTHVTPSVGCLHWVHNAVHVWVDSRFPEKIYKIFNTTQHNETTVPVLCATEEHVCAGVESITLTLLYASVFRDMARHGSNKTSCL